MFHKKSISIIITILAILSFMMGALPSQVAHASGIYYVATFGNDAWDGSESNPWSTIDHALTMVSDGDTIQVAAGPYAWNRIYVNKGVTLSFANGVVIQGFDGCFVIAANNVHLKAASAGGAKCTQIDFGMPFPGIVVNDGIQNLVIDGLDIDGSYNSMEYGIYINGSINGLQIVNSHIHNMQFDGIRFTNIPSGVIDIQGNLFENNNGSGINGPEGSAFNVQYNSWGSEYGPMSGDGISGFADSSSYTPWTHVDVSMVDTTWPLNFHLNKVFTGETITYTIRMNAVNVTGADVKLLYPAGALSFVEANTEISDFGYNPVLDSTTPGVISFHGLGGTYSTPQAVNNPNAVLFTVTFRGGNNHWDSSLDLDETSDGFTMDPGSGPSNNIYAFALSDGTITVMSKSNVTSTVSLQGRVDRSGVVVNFSTGAMNGYGPYSATSTDTLSNNLTIPNVVEDYSYTITTNVPGYLNVTSDLLKTTGVSDEDHTFAALELKAGNIYDENGSQNIIDIFDGTIIGNNYGDVSTEFVPVLVSDGDVNGDGKVDIFDLALMGGNYGLTSEAAYGSTTTGAIWVP